MTGFAELPQFVRDEVMDIEGVVHGNPFVAPPVVEQLCGGPVPFCSRRRQASFQEPLIQ
jgi:hypothetical protein